MEKLALSIILLFLFCTNAYAIDQNKQQAYDKANISNRSYGTNFKDYALLRCLQIANKKLNNPDNKDLNWAVSVFFPEWIAFEADDIEKTKNTMKAIDRLSEKYIENAGGLKQDAKATLYTFGCLNFYHSHDLEKLMLSFVLHPEMSLREEFLDL